MEEQMDNFDFGLKEANVKNPKKTIENIEKSSQATNLRTHLKTHSGEKSNKCNQCTFSLTVIKTDIFFVTVSLGISHEKNLFL